MKRKAVIGALVVTGALGSWLTGSAMAGPARSPKALVVEADCGDGPFDVVVNGNGAWTPAHVSGSNTVFIPVEFGEFNGTFTPSDGGDPVDFTEPGRIKAHAEAGGDRDLVSCTYSIENEEPDGVVTGTGSVVGWYANGG